MGKERSPRLGGLPGDPVCSPSAVACHSGRVIVQVAVRGYLECENCGVLVFMQSRLTNQNRCPHGGRHVWHPDIAPRVLTALQLCTLEHEHWSLGPAPPEFEWR